MYLRENAIKSHVQYDILSNPRNNNESAHPVLIKDLLSNEILNRINNFILSIVLIITCLLLNKQIVHQLRYT